MGWWLWAAAVRSTRPRRCRARSVFRSSRSPRPTRARSGPRASACVTGRRGSSEAGRGADVGDRLRAVAHAGAAAGRECRYGDERARPLRRGALRAGPNRGDRSIRVRRRPLDLRMASARSGGRRGPRGARATAGRGHARRGRAPRRHGPWTRDGAGARRPLRTASRDDERGLPSVRARLQPGGGGRGDRPARGGDGTRRAHRARQRAGRAGRIAPPARLRGAARGSRAAVGRGRGARPGPGQPAPRAPPKPSTDYSRRSGR